ncbi:hypothetical protein [Halolamina pelagica]|uniref:hypothetical protein n=1 Tax=Halolamina pelagica TaxID=699431 RepID=UPI0006CA778A|nr:hypothetical protein [Halolamina pelagica]
MATAWGLDEVANLAELGADKNAEAPIDELLATHATDGTLLYFPPGKYRIEETVAVNGDGRIGLLGDDAVIVPPAGFDSTVLAVGYPDPMTALFVRGLTFDYRAEKTGGRPVLGLANDLILYRDLSVRGVVDVAGISSDSTLPRPTGSGSSTASHSPTGRPSRASPAVRSATTITATWSSTTATSPGFRTTDCTPTPGGIHPRLRRLLPQQRRCGRPHHHQRAEPRPRRPGSV